MSEWFLAFSIYMGLGVVVGLLAGMLGIGGGVVIVPSLLLVFGMQGIERDMATQLAVATSLATILATSVSSARSHHRHASVEWPLVASMVPGLLLGALGGAWVSRFLSGGTVRIVFGFFAMGMALQMVFGRPPGQGRGVPGGVALCFLGALVGLFSGVIGIGGGALLVLVFLFYGLGMRQAIGTSAACTLPIAFAGALGHWAVGLGEANLPPGTWGYIHLQAALGISLASVVVAPWGARLAQRLPVVALRRVFAVFLLLLGGKFLWENFFSFPLGG